MSILRWRSTCRDCDSRNEVGPARLAASWGLLAESAQQHADQTRHAAQVEAVFREATTPLGYTRRAWRGRPGPPRRV